MYKKFEFTPKLLDNIDIIVDGKIGPVTISEINNSNPKTLLSKLIEERENYYKSLVDKNPKLKKFLNGWLNRINETNKYINNLKEED